MEIRCSDRDIQGEKICQSTQHPQLFIQPKQEALKQGKRTPEQSTMNREMSTLRRIFDELAVSDGYIKHDTVPENISIKLPKDQWNRRDDLTIKEWEELEKRSRRYYI